MPGTFRALLSCMSVLLLALHLCAAPTLEPPPASLGESGTLTALASSPDSQASPGGRIPSSSLQLPCPPLPGLASHSLRTLEFGAVGALGGFITGIAASADSRDGNSTTVMLTTALGFVGGNTWGALTADSAMERNGSVLLTLAGAVGGGLLLGAATGPTGRAEIVIPAAMLGSTLGATLTTQSFDSSPRRIGVSAWAYPGHAGLTLCGRLP